MLNETQTQKVRQIIASGQVGPVAAAMQKMSAKTDEQVIAIIADWDFNKAVEAEIIRLRGTVKKIVI